MTIFPPSQAKPIALPGSCSFILGHVALWALITNSQAGWTQEVRFNRTLLPAGSEHLDLSIFQQGNRVTPGEYSADVFVNDQLVGRNKIRFAKQRNGEVEPCFTSALLDSFGVMLPIELTESNVSTRHDVQCLLLKNTIIDGRVVFDMRTLELRMSIPQVSMQRNIRGYVSPQLWDSGANAATLGYTFTGSRGLKGAAKDSAYLGLYAGLNMGDWRLRHTGSASWQSGGADATYQSMSTYLQRGVAAFKSRLTLGETYTTGDVFDTLTYRGVELTTDDRMLPQVLRGYAPVIRGIARTSARVVIQQGGRILQEVLVAPGAFEIDDVSSSGYGGDLEVVVNEADGSQQRFYVPFTTVSQLLRPGTSRFSLTAGQLRSQFLENSPYFVQGTYQRGLNNLFTGEGGVQISENYTALQAGVALNTPLGAVGLDLTGNETRFPDQAERGTSARLLYSKSVISTGSYFTAASYWYTASGSRDFNDAAQRLDTEQHLIFGNSTRHARNRLALSANQRVGDWGQLGLSAISQRHWNASGRDVQYQLSYGTQINSVGMTLSANRNRQTLGTMQSSYLLSINFPLLFGSFDKQASRLAVRIGRDELGNLNETLDINGSAGVHNQYNYGGGVQRDGSTNGTGVSLYGQYQGGKYALGGSFNRNEDYAALGLSLNGSLVAHTRGLTLSPFRSDTMAVLSVPGGRGAEVAGFPSIKLDGQGNAIVPYLRPYEFNEVGVSLRGASMEVALARTNQKVVPTAGAVVVVDFETTTGRPFLLNISLPDGKPLPFGSSAMLADGQVLGMVGQGGQLYAKVAQGVEQVLLSWGATADQRCVLKLPLLEEVKQVLTAQDSICTPTKD